MIQFPNAKINLGLCITGKRPDGFHNLETLFLPVSLRDALEVLPDLYPEKGRKMSMEVSGVNLSGDPEQNLVVKAYRLLDQKFDLPPVKVWLHKVIPTGAGLGGGSSDAAFMLRILNELFMLNLQKTDLLSLAATLGSDCAFFIENRPSLGFGRGEILKPAAFPDQRIYPVIIKPEINISTADAFRMIQPVKPVIPIQEAILEPITKWKDTLFNDFEKTIFPQYPFIENIKKRLYELGAMYAAMTGSGSAVFGLFREPAEIQNQFPGCFVWQAETPHW